MTEKRYESLGEMMLEEKLENGLSVFVFPKPEFEKNFAFFATNYGGMDTRFQRDGVWQDTPLGVAHFLEHKMFDTKDGNALQQLSANGASPNAFTSTAITGYYFEGTDGFYDNLKTLLSFVSQGYFTQESVDKEQGIIGQEIQMIEDNPNWQAYMRLLGGLYHKHPARNSVAGTKESIAEITAQTLYDCHGAFYTPGNMVLCVAGDVDGEEVCRLAREILPKDSGETVQRDYGATEPRESFKAYDAYTMEVSLPLSQLGFKLEAQKDGQARLRQKLLGELLCEAWVGSSSPLYARLYEQGLINAGFHYGFEEYPGIAFLIMGGESSDPKQLQAAILQEAKDLLRRGIDAALFERLKKAAYGNQVRALNSFENLCIEQAQAHFAAQDVWIFPEIYASIEKSDVENALRDWISEEVMSMAVIVPKGAGE